MELVSSSKAFGGSQRVYRHDSAACACPMSFAIYLPHQIEDGPVPLLWYLSGLTCTHQNVMDKGEYRAARARVRADDRDAVGGGRGAVLALVHDVLVRAGQA